MTSDDLGSIRKSTRADYETAISATGSVFEIPAFHDYCKCSDYLIFALGYGSFHYWLLLACGWANAADAVEIM
jgi:VNT family MFS transporter (synaptic vesicle glycoprotein 2)